MTYPLSQGQNTQTNTRRGMFAILIDLFLNISTDKHIFPPSFSLSFSFAQSLVGSQVCLLQI